MPNTFEDFRFPPPSSLTPPCFCGFPKKKKVFLKLYEIRKRKKNEVNSPSECGFGGSLEVTLKYCVRIKHRYFAKLRREVGDQGFRTVHVEWQIWSVFHTVSDRNDSPERMRNNQRMYGPHGHRHTSLILRCHVPETAKSDKLFEESHEDLGMSILFGLCVASVFRKRDYCALNIINNSDTMLTWIFNRGQNRVATIVVGDNECLQHWRPSSIHYLYPSVLQDQLEEVKATCMSPFEWTLSGTRKVTRLVGSLCKPCVTRLMQ